MIYQPQAFDPEAPVVVIDVGNSAIKVGTWHRGELKTPVGVATDDPAAFAEAFTAHHEAGPDRPTATVIASVVPDALERVRAFTEKQSNRPPLIVGGQVPLPIDVGVRDPKAIGVDRVCGAAAAYETLEAGCIVVSFGTAVTVDLVDDEGILAGGAILPGVRLQMEALHERTAALPLADPGVPELPYGQDTIEAIQTGVCRGIAGAVRGIVEGYAAHLNRWPQVVATGGDAAFLAPYCDYLDTVVRDLALRGVGIAYTRYLSSRGA